VNIAINYCLQTLQVWQSMQLSWRRPRPEYVITWSWTSQNEAPTPSIKCDTFHEEQTLGRKIHSAVHFDVAGDSKAGSAATANIQTYMASVSVIGVSHCIDWSLVATLPCNAMLPDMRPVCRDATTLLWSCNNSTDYPCDSAYCSRSLSSFFSV